MTGDGQELDLGLPPKDTARIPLSAVLAAELLGERVAVKLDDSVIVVGVLLSFSDVGECTVRDDGGDVHHCWPMLSVGPAEAPGTPPPTLPPGEYARVEILGHDSHTGWVTESTRAGQPVMVVRDWDGLVIAEVPGHSLYRFVPLATPLKRPEGRLAIGPPPGWRGDWDSAEDSAYDAEAF